MKKQFNSFSESFKNALMIVDLMLIEVATELKKKLDLNGIKASKKINEIAPELSTQEREFKLLTLKLLIYSKFIDTQCYVTYSYLMQEMHIGYFELIDLLKRLAKIDIDKDDPTTDSLVTNYGDDIPPVGHFNCGVQGRSGLTTAEEYEKYHSQMMFRHCTFFGFKLRAVAKTFMHIGGTPKKLIPMTRFMKQNPNASLTHSGKRYTEFNGILKRAA